MNILFFLIGKLVLCDISLESLALCRPEDCMEQFTFLECRLWKRTLIFKEGRSCWNTGEKDNW